MDINLALALVGATALLVAIPGPNVALIVANTITFGFRFGAITVLGSTVGLALQLGVVVLGLAALLEYAASAFTWLKWLGVVYLFYLGLVAWRQGVDDLPKTSPCRKPLGTVFWQGLLLATINLKTLVFNSAFLPQFIGAHAGPDSIVAVAAIYLSVVFFGDLAWAGTAHTARPIVFKLGRLRHRLTGGLFWGAGIGLALSRVDR